MDVTAQNPSLTRAQNDGVDEELDRLRDVYANLPSVLTDYAEYEKARLTSLALVHQLGESVEHLNVCYLPQLGFMLKLPTPRVIEFDHECDRTWKKAGLHIQFENEGECYFKTEQVARLDEDVGDIRSNMKDLESHLVRELETELLKSLPALRAAQGTLSELDCLLSLASCARDLNLARPKLTSESVLHVTQGWHPLLQQNVAQLVPNDCAIGVSSDHAQTSGGDSIADRLILLTGPNASGKTVYLRTMALITYLAHVGSFVPAEGAVIGITDGIYTRMHAKESSAIKASAFMLDLQQMAMMLRCATPRSLCLIDEFGKGTNAQDGICLLYGCLQEFLERGISCPKTLTCTHYTEVLKVPGFQEQPGLALWT